MQKSYLLLLLMILTSCATVDSRKVQSIQEAVKENPNIESGIYNNTHGENVQVNVQTLKARIVDIEKQNDDLSRERDYLKRTNEQLQYENLVLRTRGNYTLEREQSKVIGFDRNSDPLIVKEKVNPEPKKVQ